MTFLRDYEGRPIRLTNERLAHILEPPEMVGPMEEAVSAPDQVVQSQSDADVRGDGVQGLVHISELTEQRIRHPQEVAAVGKLIRALVLRVDVSEKKIGLSLKQLAY